MNFVLIVLSSALTNSISVERERGKDREANEMVERHMERMVQSEREREPVRCRKRFEEIHFVCMCSVCVCMPL